MSIASPTLRSSSSTVPGPRLSSSPTSMWARPSTAETCTGTSNTASRSAAPREVASALAGARTAGSGTASSPARFGNGTLSSAIFCFSANSVSTGVAAPGRDVASDRLGDGGLGGDAVALEAAVGPFDAAIARRDVAFRHHHQPALETARAGDLLELLLGVGIEVA